MTAASLRARADSQSLLKLVRAHELDQHFVTEEFFQSSVPNSPSDARPYNNCRANRHAVSILWF